MGLFPTVMLSADDILLLRGAPALRRRFLDMTLVAIDYDYLMALKHYHQAIQERNAGLRQGVASSLLDAYERMMAQSAAILVTKRQRGMNALGGILKEYYTTMIGQDHPGTQAIYQPDFSEASEGDFITFWASQRERDKLLGSTQRGPHRDDFSFHFRSYSAKEYASEGQQRGLVLALRLAQAAYLKQERKVLPVILADDILGQLDQDTRQRFWSLIDSRQQIFATGTEEPKSQNVWELWGVKTGVFSEAYQKC